MMNLLMAPKFFVGFLNRSFVSLLALYFVSLTAAGQNELSAAQKTASPAQAEAIYAEGMQALQRGELSAARAAFEKVLRLAPRSAEAHNSLGWVLLAEGKIDPAIRELQAAVKIKPDFPQARINLANA